MTDAAAPATPSRRRSTRRLVVTLAGMVAIVGLTVAGAVAFGSANPAPRDVVVAYVEAIRDGDVETANALGSGYDAPVGSLDDAERITDVVVSDESIESTTVRGSPGAPRQETYAVTYVVGGETVETSLTVTEVGAAEPRWSLSASLERRVEVTLALETEADVLVGLEAVVAGQAVDARPSRSDELHLYPGVYALEPSQGTYASAERVDVVVGDRDVAVEVPVAPTDGLAAFVEDEALATLADCVDASVSVNLRCGPMLLGLESDITQSLGIRSGADAEAFEGVVWSIESSSIEQPAGDAWAVDVAAVVRATYPTGATTASVDFPVQAAWTLVELPGEDPTATATWYDPAEG